jgi:hypothetical protein
MSTRNASPTLGTAGTPARARSSMQSTSVSQPLSSWADLSPTANMFSLLTRHVWCRLVRGWIWQRPSKRCKPMRGPIQAPGRRILDQAPALFQYGLQDEEWVPLKDAKDYFAMSSGPKDVKFYECGHALNAQAHLDRFEFLQRHLALLPSTMGSIPDTK